MYDYLIIGSGLTGSLFAYFLKQKGKSCLVVEKRSHAGGNIYTEPIENIHVHKYGAHIFHTSDEEVWNFMNRFATFNRYTNSPLVFSRGKLYNLPFNMNTFHTLWGVSTPEEAMRMVEKQKKPYLNIIPKNLEEQALALAGKDIYELLIKEYTEKQWGRKATELPPFIIKRIPFRFTFDNNYFNDIHQGIPIGGYTTIINKFLNGTDILLDTDFIRNRYELQTKARKIIYTGRIDEFFNYRFGPLEYRSREFEHTIVQTSNYQGNAVINYADTEIPYIRIIEHKHFESGNQPVSVITKEYPTTSSSEPEPFYPINDDKNMRLYNRYKNLSATIPNLLFAGRLGEYKYYDMHQIVRNVMDTIKNHSFFNFDAFVEHEVTTGRLPTTITLSDIHD